MKLFDQDFQEWKIGDWIITESEFLESCQCNCFIDKYSAYEYMVNISVNDKVEELDAYQITGLNDTYVYFLDHFSVRIESAYRVFGKHVLIDKSQTSS